MAVSAVPHERSGPTRRSKFSEEQVVYALRKAEGGTPVGDLCRQLGVSDATFYAWKKKYAHLGGANCGGSGSWKKKTAG